MPKGSSPSRTASRSSSSTIQIAIASADDVRAIERRRNVDDVAMRLALESAERGRAWAARDDDEIIAVLLAHDSEDERYIGELFVETSYRGQGVAGRILQAAFEAQSDRGRSALLNSGDAAALALALRLRMGLREPILQFAGAIPKEEELAKMAAGDYRFNVEPLDAAAHGFALNELDRHARGTSRPADHAAFALRASGNVFFLGGECVGYAYVWADGRIGPLACASEAYLVQILAYALVTLSRTHGASWCTILVPGSNRRIARAALRAGLRVKKTFIFAADGVTSGFETYVGYHELLF